MAEDHEDLNGSDEPMRIGDDGDDDGWSSDTPEPADDQQPKRKNSNKNSDVGYGKPPIEHRYKPTQSGNPGGRPKGAKGLRAVLDSVLSKKVTLVEKASGKRSKSPTLDVMVASMATKAVNGNVSAFRSLIELLVQAQGYDDPRRKGQKLNRADQKLFDEMLRGFGSEAEAEAEGDHVDKKGEGTPDDDQEAKR